MTTVLPSRTKALPSMDQSIGNALAQTRFTLNEVQQGLSRLECLTEKPTRETFLIPLDDLCRQLQNKSGACDTFQCLHPDPDMRASVEDLKGEVDTMIVTIQQSSRLAAIMRTVDLSQLDRLDKRFVDHWTRDFLRAGAFLSPDDREQVKQMIAREGVLSRQWNRNVIEGQKSMIVSSDRLRSMSDEFLASHVPDEHGQVKLTTKYSDRMQILEYCEDETVRRDMAYLQNTVSEGHKG
jgi:Zn-dependent oligopeptidase